MNLTAVQTNPIPSDEALGSLGQSLPTLCGMAATIFAEKVVYHDDAAARKIAVKQALLLFAEMVETLEKLKEEGRK